MNTKEKIIEALKGKSKTEILAEEYIEAEKELLKELAKLENGGGACNCHNVDSIMVISDDDVPEIVTYCLNCGGYIDGI